MRNAAAKVWRLPCIVACMAVAGAAGAQSAANFPNKAIRIMTTEVGSGADTIGRMVAGPLGAALGQPVVIENHGGVVSVSPELVAKAAPDGHTLLVMSGSLWLLPLLQSVNYDMKEFAPITLGLVQPLLMVVHPSVPANSVKEFVALAKAKPGSLNYASGPGGSGPHLGGELLKALAGIDLVRVPYKGGAPAMQALLAGQTQVMFATTIQSTPQIKSGKVRALGVTTAQPSTLFPDIPTVASQGVPGFELTTTNGFFAPARTPAAIVGKLSVEINKLLQGQEMKSRLTGMGTEVINSTPEQASAVIQGDTARLGKVIKEAGIKGED